MRRRHDHQQVQHAVERARRERRVVGGEPEPGHARATTSSCPATFRRAPSRARAGTSSRRAGARARAQQARDEERVEQGPERVAAVPREVQRSRERERPRSTTRSSRAGARRSACRGRRAARAPAARRAGCCRGGSRRGPTRATGTLRPRWRYSRQAMSAGRCAAALRIQRATNTSHASHVHRELAVRRPLLVDEQADRDRRDDHRVHRAILAQEARY